jgi:hypothetical protein
MIYLELGVLCSRGWRRSPASSRSGRRPRGRRLGWDYQLPLILCGYREASHASIRRARALSCSWRTSTYVVDRGKFEARSSEGASEHLINQLSINE